MISKPGCCSRLALSFAATLLLLSVAPAAHAGEVFIGAATVSITPEEPVALAGQRHTRISTEIESPCVATAVAIETRDGDRVLDQAVMVTCDLVAIRNGLQESFRRRLKAKLPDLDVSKLFLAATHTHTAPVTSEGVYLIPDEGVVKVAEYIEFLQARLEELVVQAWQSRRKGGVAWGLGHALVAHNRRAVYANGTARMYGDTDGPAFRGIEGYEDHYVDVLFFFDAQSEMIAAAVNVACPSQEVESRNRVNADFWHETRELLRARYGQQLHVLPWTGAGGDQSPHLMWYERAEERMRKLRGITRLAEIARRIDLAVDEAYQGAKQEIHFDTDLVHQVTSMRMPARMVTQEEFLKSKAIVDAFAAEETPDPRKSLERMWNQSIVDRYSQQQANPNYTTEVHAIRLGDVAICTNPFELYTEFGVRIKSRSKAVQTFVVQLACESGAYLPTAEAIRSGSYSTAVFSNLVGPEGGTVLVDETVAAINALWP